MIIAEMMITNAKALIDQQYGSAPIAAHLLRGLSWGAGGEHGTAT